MVNGDVFTSNNSYMVATSSATFTAIDVTPEVITLTASQIATFQATPLPQSSIDWSLQGGITGTGQGTLTATGNSATYTAPATIVPDSGSSTATVYVCASEHGNSVNSYCAVVTLGGQSIVANINGGTDEKATASSSLTATFPLGGDFTIALVDTTGTVIPSDYVFSSPSVAGNVPQYALFPNSVAFQYSDNVSNRGSFHAAHLGNVTLTITPTDSQSGVQPANVNVVVVNPASLGSSHPEVDGLIYPVANTTGIPPNFIKAQMAQESGSQFNPLAYRYEPLSQDASFISRGLDLRTSDFSNYRFATVRDTKDRALSQGVNVDSDDLATVNKFPCCGSTPTVLQILNSYTKQNWRKQPGGEEEFQYLIQYKDDFTAQTSLASSYGYMQITYTTAIQKMKWTGVNGMKNPTLLFDTDSNLNLGGGSLKIGNQYLKKLYSTYNSSISVDPSLQISGPDTFIETFRGPWMTYNGKGKAATAYPNKVITRIPAYAIIAASSIF